MSLGADTVSDQEIGDNTNRPQSELSCGLIVMQLQLKVLVLAYVNNCNKTSSYL